MSTAHADELPAVTAVFTDLFAGAPELAEYSDSARRVLAVAAALFLRRGAASTSIRDITGQCGLTPGALYRHFASKDELLHTIVDLGHTRMESRIDSALDAAPPDPHGQVVAFVRAYVTGHLTQPELAQLVRREYLQLSPRHRDAIVRRRRRLRARLAGLLQAGMHAGVFDLLGGTEGATRAAVMLLDLCSRTSDWYHAERDRTLDRLAESYVAAALRIVGTGPAPGSTG